MTRRQRIAAAVAGGLAAALVLAVVLAALLDRSADDELTTDLTAPTTTPAEDTTSTSGLELPTTTAPATTTTTATPGTTTTTRARPVVDGRGAVLRAPASPARRTMRGDDCATLADPEWEPACDRVTADVVWLTEARALAGGATAHRAFVLRHQADDTWTVALEARDDDGSRFTDVKVRVEDVSGDGIAEAAFGFHRTGSTRVLALDLVAPDATVAVHRESPDGSARVSPGQLDVWEASGAAYDHLTIRFVDGAWRIVATSRVERSAVPPSQL